MPFTDKQFDEFIKAMDTREMLVRIDENTKNFHANITKRLDDHIAGDYVEHGTQKQNVAKAHDRVDKIETEQTKIKGIVIGVGAVATVLLSALQLWIAFVKH